jgi:hypothetical protein
MKLIKLTAMGIAASALFAGSASAAIFGIGGGNFSDQPAGWDQNPGTLGPYSMTKYDLFDPQFPPPPSSPINTTTAHADSGPTHWVDFGATVSHRHIGFGWATWSGGYTGSVYYTGGAQSLMLNMAPGTVAFSLFFEPNPFDLRVFTVTGTDSDGNSVVITQDAHGSSGATWAGFWTTGGATLANIQVTTNTDFAVGWFSYSLVPAPGALALLGMAGLVGVRRRRS